MVAIQAQVTVTNNTTLLNKTLLCWS